MKRQTTYVAALCFAIGSVDGCSVSSRVTTSQPKNPPEFQVWSPNFADGSALPAEYSCANKPFATGYSPELHWSPGPVGTQSYAVVFADATLIAAGNPNYGYHWAIWNIPHKQRSLPEGIPGVFPAAPEKIVPLPASLIGADHAQARDVKQFFAPCPSWLTYCTSGAQPLSKDTYTFTVYALPEAKLVVPRYNPEVNPNYVATLHRLFDAIALDRSVVSATSEAAPISLPFPCPQ